MKAPATCISNFCRNVLLAFFFLATPLAALAASIGTSSSSITLGQTITVSVGVSTGQGYCDLSSSPSGLSGQVGHGSSKSFKPTSATTYTLRASCVAYSAMGSQSESASKSLSVAPLPADAKPSVSLSSPYHNQSVTVGGTLNVNASASDDKGVSYVDFYVAGAKKYRDNSAPYGYTWPITSAGSYSIYAKACDTKSQCTNSSTKTAKAINPVITLKTSEVSDSDGSYTLSWTGVASTSNYIVRETHSNSGAWRDINAGTNSSIGVNPAKGNGNYTYSMTFMVCREGSCTPGLTTNSVAVAVALIKPSTPAGLTTLRNSSDQYDTSWGASNNILSSYANYQVRRRLNAGSWATIKSGGLDRSVNNQPLTAGTYDYQVRACNDTSCSSWSTSYTYRVNTPPSAVIIQPAASSLFIGNPTELAVNASDSDGHIVKVEYFIASGEVSSVQQVLNPPSSCDTDPGRSPLDCLVPLSEQSASNWPFTLIASADTGSFSADWTPASDGRFTLVARAWDDSGDWSLSAEKFISVEKPLPPVFDNKDNVTGLSPQTVSVAEALLSWQPPQPNKGSLHYVLEKASLPRSVLTANATDPGRSDPSYQFVYEAQLLADATWLTVTTTPEENFRVLGLVDGIHYYRTKACDDSDWCSEWSNFARLDTELAPGVFKQDAISTNTVPGNMAYSASVNGRGEASIKIPLRLPAGAKGMQPDLDIVYNSGRIQRLNQTLLNFNGDWDVASGLPGDYIGVGWRFAGLSKIHKCTTGISEGDAASMNLRGEGRLCLDGSPLQLVKSTAEGNVFYLENNQMIRVEELGEFDDTWYRVTMPNGTVREYGKNPYSKMRIVAGTNLYPIHTWGITQSRDLFGNSIKYNYFAETQHNYIYPQSITYGPNDDTRIEFFYGQREDTASLTPAEWKQVGIGKYALRRIDVSVKENGSYRLAKKTILYHSVPGNVPQDRRAYRQLEQVQECGYDSAGTETCFKPIRFGWNFNSDSAIDLPSYVSRITDSHGMETEFALKDISAAGAHFDERPFGEVSLPAGTRTAGTQANGSARAGYQRHVVTQMQRSNGIGGKITTSYAYQGMGAEGNNSEGFLGFAAQRIQQTTGAVSYKQFRLDAPFAGKLAAEQSYAGIFGEAASYPLAKTENHYSNQTLQHSVSAQKANVYDTEKLYNGLVNYPYLKTGSSYRYESGQLVSVQQVVNDHSFDSQGFISATTQTSTQSSATSQSYQAGSIWGQGRVASLASQLRRQTKTSSFLHRLSDHGTWLTAFKTAENIDYYSASNSLDRSTGIDSSPYAGSVATNLVGSQTQFSGDTNLELTTTFSYHGSGQLSATSVSGANVAPRTSYIDSYQDDLFPSATRNALGHPSSAGYDRVSGQITSATDANGLTSINHYNALGQLLTSTTPDDITVTRSYDFCGQVTCPAGAIYRVATASPIAPLSHSYHDSLDRVIETQSEGFNGDTIYQTTRYDTLGRVERNSQAHFSSETPVYTRYEYDDITGRTLAEYQPHGGELHSEYRFDADHGGVKTTVTRKVNDTDGNPLDDQVKITYLNALGEVAERIDAFGSAEQVATEFSYDGAGFNDTISVNGQLNVSFEFDDAGNRTLLRDPNVGDVYSSYNGLGQLLSSTDNSGHISTFSYDGLGRPASQISSSDGTQNWFYDPANAMGALDYTEFVDTNSDYYHRQDFSYNSDAKLQSTETQIKVPGFAQRSYQQSQTYDASGRPKVVTHPSGYQTTNHYNLYGFVEKSTDSSGSVLHQVSAMDAYGQVQEESYGSGINSSRRYDPLSGRMIGATASIGSQTLQDSEYQWRSNGLLEQRDNNQQGVSETFAYDAINRLKTASTYKGSMVRQLSTDYDLLGNITRKVTGLGEGKNVTAYQYDVSAGVAGQGGINAVNEVDIDGTHYTLTYNANGGITYYDAATGSDKWVQWSGRGKPTRISKGPSEAAFTARDDFAYGVDGMRYYHKTQWYKAGDLKTQHTFYVGGFEDVLTDADSTYSRLEKAYLGNQIQVRATRLDLGVDNFAEYLVTDHLGSVEAVIDEAGVVLNLAYDPYGERRDANWLGQLDETELTALADELGIKTSRGYTGHEHLDRTGLIHMNGRVYDPVLGRFLSPDPFVQSPYFSQSYNRYSYAWNNPVANTDPSGYVTMTVDGCGVGCNSYDFGGGSSGGSGSGGSSYKGENGFQVNSDNGRLEAVDSFDDGGNASFDSTGSWSLTYSTGQNYGNVAPGGVLLSHSVFDDFGTASMSEAMFTDNYSYRDSEIPCINCPDTPSTRTPDTFGEGVVDFLAEGWRLSEGLNPAVSAGIAGTKLAVVLVARARPLAAPVFKTTKEATAAAKNLGFSKVNETVHGGQAVFKRGKLYITRDLDGHNGGAWKMAKSVKALSSKDTRMGTFNSALTSKIGD